MADGPRKIQPVRFLDDPRIPTQGLRDFSPRYTPVDAAPEQEEPEQPKNQSSVYGGRRKPNSEQPVVMDKHLPGESSAAHEPANPDPAPDPDLADVSGGKPDKSGESAPDQARGDQAGDQTGKASQRKNDNGAGSQARAEGNGGESQPKSRKQSDKGE